MIELIGFMQQWPTQYKNYKRRDEKTAWQYALITLLYCYTAARADEVLSLKIKDITESSILHEGKYEEFYIILFQTTKGNKYRESAVKKELIEVFVEKIKSLISEDFYISSQFVDHNFINKKIADSTMYRFITWALKSLGINKTGRHIIRRGYATNELAEGKDIGVVAIDLGHESIHTTIKHYVKNNPELMMKRRLSK
jgi:integrase/recombinase XerD